MRLWLERFVLTICAAVVISLTILNPLKWDWQQRVSLAIAVSAFAYFVAHTVHKPVPVPTQQDQRIAFLEQQIQNLQAQLQQIATQEAAKEKESERQRKIKTELAVFLREAEAIQNRLLYNDPPAVEKMYEWEKRVEEYLKTNLDESYKMRFRNPSHQEHSDPEDIDNGFLPYWREITARMATLNDFISELRD